MVFWASGKKFIPLALAGLLILCLFPFLSFVCILFAKWPHPFLTAWKDLAQKKITPSFPTSQKPKGTKLFNIDTEDKPHLIFIYLESFRAKNVGCLGATNGLSPHFDSLAKEGILFTRFHSTGNLTNRSIIASLFGVPAAHQPWHLGHYCDISLTSLPKILSEHGYHTALIQGSSLAFDHEAEFFQKHGFQTILGKRDIGKPGNSWGVYDEYLMPFAASWLSNQKAPTFLSLMTITNHHPWQNPNGPNGFLNTFSYTDGSLKLLIDELDKKALLEKSILFIFGDHGQELEDRAPHFEVNRHLYQDNVHVPLLIYGKGRTTGKMIETLSSQIDLLPTVLDLMNYSTPHQSLGKSLLRPSSEPIYFSHPFDTPIQGCRFGNWKYLIQDSFEELYNIDQDPEEKNNLISHGPSLKDQTLRFFENLDTFYLGKTREKKETSLHLEFCNSFITDMELEKTGQTHPDLVSISLQNCMLISDQGIKALLTHCQKLEKLILDGCEDLTTLHFPNGSHLVHLQVSNCPKMNLSWITQLPSLQVLNLSGVPLNDNELISFSSALKHLVSLQLKSLYEITDRGLAPLISKNFELMILMLEDCPEITEQSLDAVQKKPLRYQRVLDCIRISDFPMTPCQ